MSQSTPVPGAMPAVTFLDAATLEQLSACQILAHMLSTKSYISTDSAQDDKRRKGLAFRKVLESMVATRCWTSAPRPNAARELGAGMCGVVYALHGTEWAIKLPKPSANMADALYEDFCTHKEVEEAFDSLPSTTRPAINIPRVGGWVHPDNDEFWKLYESHLPAKTPRNYGLVSSRILPLPEPVRKAAWQYFAPPDLRYGAVADRALAEARNQDCLIRVYLGRRRLRAVSPAFQLRNLEVRINEIEQLGLDPKVYAGAMADTLALLHWKAGVDANDVEFVLGSLSLVMPAATAAEHRRVDKDGARYLGQELSFTRRAIAFGLWLLDFHQCRKFFHTMEGLKQIVHAFRWNDPYYPRPGGKETRDRRLWAYFEQTYRDKSASFGAPSWMVESFIREVKLLGTVQAVDLLD